VAHRRPNIVILNQCFAGRFTDIAMSLDNAVIITETEESEMAIKVKRKTLRWKLLRLNLVVSGLNLIDPVSLTITGKEKCRQKQGLQLAA